MAVFTATTVSVGCGGRATETVRVDGGSTGGLGSGGVGAAPGAGGDHVGAGGLVTGAGGFPASGGIPGAGGLAVMYGPAPFTGGFPGVGGTQGAGGTVSSGGVPNGGASGASGAAPSDAGTAVDSPDGALNCIDEFSGGTPSRCCPVPPPDCTNKPDGYPGYGCTPAPRSFCSCTCEGGKWSCGC
ncbi:MAG TPA: hypothetical protein VHC69_06105 [Polyangiaceae bacterium]|nr:hypothetical protein [Polyangiaceae bacterium]